MGVMCSMCFRFKLHAGESYFRVCCSQICNTVVEFVGVLRGVVVYMVRVVWVRWTFLSPPVGWGVRREVVPGAGLESKR